MRVRKVEVDMCPSSAMGASGAAQGASGTNAHGGRLAAFPQQCDTSASGGGGRGGGDGGVR